MKRIAIYLLLALTVPLVQAQSLPYEVRLAAQKYPVTLYTTKECDSCDQGRQLLQTRGVPFTEKTIATHADVDAMKKIAPGNSFPVLTVGSQKLTGFQADNWDQALDLAGYPKKNILPRSYKNPPASSLAENSEAKPAAPPPATSAPAPSISSEPPPKPSNAPPGFRF